MARKYTRKAKPEKIESETPAEIPQGPVPPPPPVPVKSEAEQAEYTPYEAMEALETNEQAIKLWIQHGILKLNERHNITGGSLREWKKKVNAHDQ